MMSRMVSMFRLPAFRFVDGHYPALAPYSRTSAAVRRRRPAGALDERLALALGGVARQVLRAAAGRRDQTRGVSVGEGAANPPGDGVRRLHLVGREIDDAEDDRLVGERVEHVEGKARLGRLDADLVALGRGELGQERVAARALVDDRRVAEADVHRKRAVDAVGGALEDLE